MKLTCALLAFALIVPLAAARTPETGVKSIVSSRISALGHRNWIVIADSAYPWQTSPGVETVTVSESQIDAVKDLLAVLVKSRNVRPVIHLDAELPYVAEKNSPGITRFRSQLAKALKGHKTDSQLHEKIIAKLDEAGKTFKVLLIKTPHTMPYTSVFVELQCGYWSDSAEKQMREAMAKGGK